jgi:adenylosuccinate lyase
MRANLDAQGGYVLAESVMLALAERVGKDRAHTLVYEAAARGVAQGMPLRDALLADPGIAVHLAAGDLDELLRPERSLGAIDELIDRVLR